MTGSRPPNCPSSWRRKRGAQHHLVLAADVFVYCGDLAPIAAAVARVMAPGGLFAFTVESHDGPACLLQPTLRYAHGAAHVRGGASKRRAATAPSRAGLDPQGKGRLGSRPGCRRHGAATSSA